MKNVICFDIETLEKDLFPTYKFDSTDNMNSISNKNPFILGFQDFTGEYKSLDKCIIPMKYTKFLKELTKRVSKNPEHFSKKPFEQYAFVTSLVSSGAVKSLDEYLMLLDVDIEDGLKDTVQWLNKNKITHIVVKSRPSRFWIICDKVGTVDSLTEFMMQIPCVDYNYTECSRKQDVLLYRAFPRSGFIPHIGNIDHIKGSNKFKKWVRKFKEFWESKEIKEVADILLIEEL